MTASGDDLYAMLLSVRRDARVDLLVALRSLAEALGRPAPRAVQDRAVQLYATLRSRRMPGVTPLEVDRAMGAYVRWGRAIGCRREARQLASVVRRATKVGR